VLGESIYRRYLNENFKDLNFIYSQLGVGYYITNTYGLKCLSANYGTLP